MRTRPLAALSLAAVAAVLLAGCASGTSDPESTTASAASDDVCAAAATSGAASDAVAVEGEVGSEPTASFAAPLDVTTIERTVAVEGEGAVLADGDYVDYALSVFDASTGELVDASGYGDASLSPIQLTSGSGADQFIGCASIGSRIVVALPSSDGTSAAQVYVLDVLGSTPADQWCAIGEDSSGLPAVTFDDAGVPTIAAPSGDAPGDVRLQVLTEGDGEVVESGDSVTVNYTGMKWSDGTVFDSSWESGEPATFTTTGVVAGFQRALEGQKVGSTVLVSMPPSCGYGEAGSSSSELAGQTLVFVLNIVSREAAQ